MLWLFQYAIFGLVAGAIARMLHPGKDPMNWIWTMLLGIGGAMAGGWIGGMLGVNTDEGIMSWVAAITGSILLLVLYHFATRKDLTSPGTTTTATSDDYKRGVFNDLSRGPRG